MPIQVLLYEDNTLLRDALSILVDGTDGFNLVGAFGDCLSIESQVKALRPDVILMDIDLPGLNGIAATALLQQKFAHVDVLILTVFDDDERVFEAIQAGATGYLLKKTPPARILSAIQEVYEGGAPMSPAIARKVIASMRIQPNEELLRLTDRESQILALLAEGNSYKMVADRAGISIETVRTHIKRIYEKLHVHSVTEAVAKYLKR